MMQFTGLRDKAGREIYEGDILRSNNGRIWEVKFGSCLKGSIAIEAAFYCEDVKNHDEDVVMEWAEDEIIGNIHENQELLK